MHTKWGLMHIHEYMHLIKFSLVQISLKLSIYPHMYWLLIFCIIWIINLKWILSMKYRNKHLNRSSFVIGVVKKSMELILEKIWKRMIKKKWWKKPGKSLIKNLQIGLPLQPIEINKTNTLFMTYIWVQPETSQRYHY